MNKPLITLDSVIVSYGRKKALQGISGTFMAGSLTAVAGPNGAGKSTLLRTIAGLIRPKQGSITFHAPLTDKKASGSMTQPRIAYMPQTTTMQRNLPLTVKMVATMGLWSHIGLWKPITPQRRARVDEALEMVGLHNMRNVPISHLSGGQWQRLLFAQVIVQDASIILLDEPFAAVDAETTQTLMRVTLDWHHAGRTVICVLHDLWLVRKYFPESFVLAGQCLGRGHTHTLFENKLLSFDLDMAELHEGTSRP